MRPDDRVFAVDLEPLDQPTGRPPVADTRLHWVDRKGWMVTVEYVDGSVSEHRSNELLELSTSDKARHE